MTSTAFFFGALAVLRFLRLRAIVLYALPVLGCLFFTYHSGTHTTIAGVALGLLVPARPLSRREGFLARTEELTSEFRELRKEIGRLKEQAQSREDLEEIEQLRENEDAVLGS